MAGDNNKGQAEAAPEQIPTIRTIEEAQALGAKIGEGTIDKATKFQDNTNVINLFLKQDEEVLDNSLRLDLVDRRQCIAYATLFSGMAHNPGAIYELKLSLGFQASIGAKRAQLASDWCSDARMASRLARSRRETCTWLTPTSSPMRAWVKPCT